MWCMWDSKRGWLQAKCCISGPIFVDSAQNTFDWCWETGVNDTCIFFLCYFGPCPAFIEGYWLCVPPCGIPPALLGGISWYPSTSYYFKKNQIDSTRVNALYLHAPNNSSFLSTTCRSLSCRELSVTQQKSRAHRPAQGSLMAGPQWCDCRVWPRLSLQSLVPYTLYYGFSP